MRAQAPITRVSAAAYTIPTDAPEADGTLAWHDTTIVVVHAEAGVPRARIIAAKDAGAFSAHATW